MELKCNISLVDRLYRRTALHIAAESNPEMIPFLLEAGLKGFFCDEWMIFRGVTRSKPRWVVPKIGGNTQNGWFIMENPIKHGMIWGITYPYFWKHPGIPSSFRDGATAV